MKSLIQQELESRENFKKEVLQLILNICEVVEDKHSKVARGKLQKLIYHSLGFHGRPGNHFSIFINKLLQESGFVCTISRGKRSVTGLRWK